MIDSFVRIKAIQVLGTISAAQDIPFSIFDKIIVSCKVGMLTERRKALPKD